MHGELVFSVDFPRDISGSSPRAWGTQKARSILRWKNRFIPTCMGNSPALLLISMPGPVHPHVHGELPRPRAGVSAGGGSSPRAWGTPPPGPDDMHLDRFIPTCMGNSDWTSVMNHPLSVHPHVHGELCRGTGSIAPIGGSSPRAWGTLLNFYMRTWKIISWIIFWYSSGIEFAYK